MQNTAAYMQECYMCFQNWTLYAIWSSKNCLNNTYFFSYFYFSCSLNLPCCLFFYLSSSFYSFSFSSFFFSLQTWNHLCSGNRLAKYRLQLLVNYNKRNWETLFDEKIPSFYRNSSKFDFGRISCAKTVSTMTRTWNNHKILFQAERNKLPARNRDDLSEPLNVPEICSLES